MRRFPRALFVACVLVGCQERTQGGASSSSSSSAPLVFEPIAATPVGGRHLHHVQRLFPKPRDGHAWKHARKDRPLVEASAVDGFLREGQGDAATWQAVPSAPRGQVAQAQVRLPSLFDGPLDVASNGVSISVRPIGLARSKIEWAQRVAVHPEVAPGTTAFRRVDGDGVEDLFLVERASDVLSYTYDVTLHGVAGLRLVEGTLELLDAEGTPRLRAPAPIVFDANGAKRLGAISVRGCAYDHDPSGPWGRPVVAPGSDRCIVEAKIDARGLAFPVLVDPSWTATGNTKQTHASHTLLALAGGTDAGKVLLVGGTGTVPALTELYDPATATWASSSSMPDGLGEGSRAVALSNGTVVVAGGLSPTSGSTAKGLVLVRAPGGTWGYGAAMSSPRAWHAMAVVTIGGKEVALVAGGRPNETTYEKPSKSVEYYDATTDSWTTTAAMSIERSSAGWTVLSDGRLLVVGGHGYTTYSIEHTSAEIFNPVTKTWSAAGNLATERSDAAVVALPGGKAVAIGGWNDWDYTLRTIEYFDGTAWSAIAGKGMAEPRMFHVAAPLADGRILIAGGNVEPDDPTYAMTASATAEILDPGADPKTAAKIGATVPMATARIFAAGVVLGSKVLVAGGRTGEATGTETTSSEIFDLSVGSACGTGCPAGLFCTEGVCCKSASCPEGQTCAAPGYEGVCTKPKGSSCTSNAECATGFCVTGVCCSTACSGGCQACNAAGSVGDCVDATAGTDPSSYCGGDPFCGPFCDGTGDCFYDAPAGTKCGASATDAGTGAFCTSYACDGFWDDCVETTNDCGLTCTTKVTCDEATKTCSPLIDGVKAGYCVIDGACWSYGDVDPKDACHLCDPPSSKTSWTTADSCADGGVPDTGTDAGEDATDDGGAVDTGPNDTGPNDTGALDTGPKDTGVVDTGTGVADASVDASSPADDLPEAQACGCEVPGGRRERALPIALFGLAAVLVARRRRV